MLTTETVLAGQFNMLETKLGGCLALLNERADLCNKMASGARARGESAGPFEAAAHQALSRAELLKQLLEAEWVHPLAIPEHPVR